MALTDINFQESEGQDFIGEIPTASYDGILTDVQVETDSGQYLLLETPLVTGGGGGNIFIVND